MHLKEPNENYYLDTLCSSPINATGTEVRSLMAFTVRYGLTIYKNHKV